MAFYDHTPKHNLSVLNGFGTQSIYDSLNSWNIAYDVEGDADLIPRADFRLPFFSSGVPDFTVCPDELWRLHSPASIFANLMADYPEWDLSI